MVEGHPTLTIKLFTINDSIYDFAMLVGMNITFLLEVSRPFDWYGPKS